MIFHSYVSSLPEGIYIYITLYNPYCNIVCKTHFEATIIRI